MDSNTANNKSNARGTPRIRRHFTESSLRVSRPDFAQAIRRRRPTLCMRIDASCKEIANV